MHRRARTLSLAILTLFWAGCDDPIPLFDAGGPMDAGETDAGTPQLSCDNNELDGDETSIDCGGSCPACPDGENCAVPEDCESSVCNRGRCLVPNCLDGVQNGDETGADCGGDCGLCPGGEPCSSNEQCLSGRCRGGMCTMSDCEDGTQNGTETDVDCGGDPCPACRGGFNCNTGTDCESLICSMGVCTDAACNDGVQNQDETSVDCGGSLCPGCREGLACQIDADCQMNRCFDGGCVSCVDRIMNAEETGVDCGGGGLCPACADGQTCVVDADCASLNCVDTDMNGSEDTCQSCMDGTLNQDESDVDCGGAFCVGCPAGGACRDNNDCDMGSCSMATSTCVNCLDNIRNQDESDVDCGGTFCLGCGPGFMCTTGTDCASGVCTASRCVGLSPNPTFQITQLTDLACSTVDHNSLSGDDRGGIGITDQVVMYTGDTATVRYQHDLTGGTALFPPTLLSGVARDAMVTNMANGQIYALTNAGTPLPSGGGVITQLVPVNADGSLSAAGRITLSIPVVATGPTCCTGNVGIFAGWNRIVIHDGAVVHSIAIPSGTVTNLGAMVRPTHTGCESWAYYGIAETDGANTNLVYVQNTASIVKTRVPTGAVQGTFPFTNLGGICMFTGNVMRNRWYFQYEFSSQFGGSGETVGYCGATFDTTAGNFRVTAMNATGCAINDYGTTFLGDDRGGIAVSNTHLFYNGDSALGRFSAADLSGAVNSGGVGIQHDAIVSDLRAGHSYLLASATGPLVRSPAGGTVTRLIQLDPATGQVTTTQITLSSPITLPTFNVGIFSGWNRIILHTGSTAFRVELPSGTVTNLGSMAAPVHRTCESWAYWGIAEFFGGADHIVMVNNTSQIVRYAVPSGVMENTWPFTNLSDMCSITFSPHTNRWYFHHEGSSQFTTGTSFETLGYCRGVYGNP